MNIKYRKPVMRNSSLTAVERANTIIREYQAQGYSLTLRQLYYQHVARGFIANKDTEYKKLGELIANARYAGLISWRAIEDRTRNLMGLPHWEDPETFIKSVMSQYRTPKWENQPYRVEIWVEKEALAGIVQRTASRLDVGYMACRGYMSASEMWEAAQRFIRYRKNNQTPIVFHLGDHDPSGVHMSTDIQNRISEFMWGHRVIPFEFERLALNMDQVEQYNPPPNPAKMTDSRCADYVEKYGDESWELDALEPSVLDGLMTTAVLRVRDDARWNSDSAQEASEKSLFQRISDNWDGICEHVESEYPTDDSDDAQDEDDTYSED